MEFPLVKDKRHGSPFTEYALPNAIALSTNHPAHPRWFLLRSFLAQVGDT
jgi:hypothetical protein